jgi:hypothetical protein
MYAGRTGVVLREKGCQGAREELAFGMHRRNWVSAHTLTPPSSISVVGDCILVREHYSDDRCVQVGMGRMNGTDCVLASLHGYVTCCDPETTNKCGGLPYPPYIVTREDSPTWPLYASFATCT